MTKPVDLTGQRFGRLTVMRREGSKQYADGSTRAAWRARCDCGVEVVRDGVVIRRSRNQSCGCWQREDLSARRTVHGMSDTRTFNSWMSMLGRCSNPKLDNFRHYGGRGISVCDRWRESFAAFLEDMGERPAGKSLDRIDPNGNYEPANCRWATQSEQMNNLRATVRYSALGRSLTLKEWERETGIGARLLWERIHRHGWATEVAVSRPARAQHSRRQ